MQRLRASCFDDSVLLRLMNAPTCARQLVFHVLSERTRPSATSRRQSIGTDSRRSHPINEQRAIAAFLDRETAKIDGLVERKERLIDLLQEKRTALITHAVTRGLDPNVPMKDSGVEWLGDIPEHWSPARLWRLSQRDERRDTGEGESSVLEWRNPLGIAKGHETPGDRDLRGSDHTTGPRRDRHQAHHTTGRSDCRARDDTGTQFPGGCNVSFGDHQSGHEGAEADRRHRYHLLLRGLWTASQVESSLRW